MTVSCRERKNTTGINYCSRGYDPIPQTTNFVKREKQKGTTMTTSGRRVLLRRVLSSGSCGRPWTSPVAVSTFMQVASRNYGSMASVSLSTSSKKPSPASPASSPFQKRRDTVLTTFQKRSRICVEIDSQLRSANNWTEVFAVYDVSSTLFNNQNWATLFTQLKKLPRDNNIPLNNNPFLQSILKSLHQLLQNRFEEFQTQHIANIAHALATLRIKDSSTPILATLVQQQHADYLVQKGKPKHMANVLWACAKSGLDARNLVTAMDATTDDWMPIANVRDLAMIAWSCATIKVYAPNFFAAIDDNNHVQQLLRYGSPQVIANTLWACAVFRQFAPNLLNGLEQNAESFVQDAKPQELANVAWAFATLGYCEAPTLFHAIDSLARQWMRAAHPQDIALVAWSVATLQTFPAPIFFRNLDANAVSFVQGGANLDPLAISNTAWACGAMYEKVPRLFQCIDETAAMLVSVAQPEELAKILWASAVLDYKLSNLFRLVDAQAHSIVENGCPQSMSLTIWACATSRLDAPTLVQAVDQHSDRLVENGSSQAIANTAIAFAKLDCQTAVFFRTLATHVDRFLASATEQHVCNTLYSLAILDFQDDPNVLALLHTLWNRALESDAKSLVSEQLRQLAYVHVYAKINGIELKATPSELQRRIKESTEGKRTTIGWFEDEYSTLLHEIGFHHEREVPPMDNDSTGAFLAIDFADSEHRIAVEYDGEYHFLTNVTETGPTYRANGPTKSKRRLLKKLGWKVVSIPYFDDIALNEQVAGRAKRKEAKVQYLKTKLTQGGILLEDAMYR